MVGQIDGGGSVRVRRVLEGELVLVVQFNQQLNRNIARESAQDTAHMRTVASRIRE